MIRFAGENTIADAASLSMRNGECVRAVNCDIDDSGNAVRRDGFTLVTGGETTSLWGNYCVQNSKICYFDGATVSPMSDEIIVLAEVHFEQVNNIVVFSDGLVYGKIDNGTITVLDNTTDWNALANDVTQWVENHAPADFQAVVSNFEVDTFKLSTQAGKHLVFADGCVYFAVAVGDASFVFRTDTFNVDRTDIRFNVVAGFPQTITAIRAVADALYVGTTGGTYFLEGHALVVLPDGSKVGGFTQKKIDAYGIIEGTDLTISGEAIPSIQTSAEVIMWTCRQGIMVGLPNGNVINLSSRKVDFPNVAKGAAVLRDHNTLKIKQYIVCFDVDVLDGAGAIVAVDLTGTRVVNLNSMVRPDGSHSYAHSRYERFPFNSLTRIGNDCYGANAAGIFLIGGETDNGAQIDGYARSLVTDFAVKEQKNVPDVYAHARCEGSLLISTFVDEVLRSDDVPVSFDGNPGIHRRRCELPLGVFGTSWQFMFKNQDGNRFTVAGLDPVATKSVSRVS